MIKGLKKITKTLELKWKIQKKNLNIIIVSQLY